MNFDYKQELSKNGILAFVPSGQSMWPTLKNKKQSVVVIPKTIRLNKYDVGLYQKENGNYVLHRVISVTDNGYIMCGDSQFKPEMVNEEQVFAVMQGFYKGKRYIQSSDEKYCKFVKRWYKNLSWRKFRIKTHYFFIRVKNKISRLFSKKDN